jgi:demethylsterigmatocystin 6-O-methyltransferase
MDLLIKQIEEMGEQASDLERRQMLDALYKLQHKLEEPLDMLQRFAGMHVQLTAARIGLNMGVFKTLHGSQEPLTTTQLSEKLDASPVLLGTKSPEPALTITLLTQDRTFVAILCLCRHGARD